METGVGLDETGLGGGVSGRDAFTGRTDGLLETAGAGGSGKRGKVMFVTIPNQQIED